jgi:hypothetical protein
VPGEDGVGRRRGEVTALVGVARLEDDRAPLRAAGHVELPRDVEEGVLVLERAGRRRRQEPAVALVGDDLVALPGIPQFGRRPQEGARPLVTVVLGQVAGPPEVLSGEGVPAGHDVPGGPAAGQVIEAGELAGHLVRFVERRVDRAGEAQVVGDGRQRGEDGEGIRAPDHVQVVDQPVLLAQAQALGQEQEVELAPLGGLGEAGERVELDVAAGRRVAPHGRVVHAREVRRQVDLLCHAGVLTLG